MDWHEWQRRCRPGRTRSTALHAVHLYCGKLTSSVCFVFIFASPVLRVELRGGRARRLVILGFEALPNPWKMALLDMAFNLGLKGLLDGYPRMLAAVQAGNGQMAAVESHRNGIGDARNAWTRNQFSGTMEG